MEIKVVDPGRGMEVTLEVEPDATVRSVKDEACAALGLRPEGYVLTRGEAALPEAFTLAEVGVGGGEVLVLLPRGVWEVLSRVR